MNDIPIGIMQGRLSLPVSDHIQAFPGADWRSEFGRARDAGLFCIEWIYEAGSDIHNPLREVEGVEEVRGLIAESGVRVVSICADYYMTELLVGADGTPSAQNVEHLKWLLERAGQLNIGYMVLPFVDSSSLSSSRQVDGAKEVLRDVLGQAEKHGVELHLETDLRPANLAAVIESIGHPLIRANYDTGNSASLGYDPVEELEAIGSVLGSVHIKDRVRGGGTVPLGEGHADFPVSLRLLDECGFTGPYILQVARGNDGDEVELAVLNREFVENHIALL